MISVRFLSRQQAEALQPAPGTLMISISTPGDAPARLKEGYQAVLRLAFDDLYEEVLGISPGALPDDTPEGGVRWKVYALPVAGHARAICEFLARYAPAPVIVRCDAGISRSAAVAQFVAGRYDATILNNNPDTSCANRRLLRLLNKVDRGAPLDIRTAPDIDALRQPSSGAAILSATSPAKEQAYE